VDDYSLTNVYNESQDSTQNSVVNNDSTPTMVFRHAKNIQKTTITDSMGDNFSHSMGDNHFSVMVI
jgi:hypothetical protein